MSEKVVIKLVGGEQRIRARNLIGRAPDGFVVTIGEATRTLDQNAKLWAMLADVRRAKPEGRVWTDEQWKAVFMDACGHQADFVNKLDEPGFVCIGFKSSRLTKSQFGDLIECIYAYGARHDIQWSEPMERAA